MKEPVLRCSGWRLLSSHGLVHASANTSRPAARALSRAEADAPVQSPAVRLLQRCGRGPVMPGQPYPAGVHEGLQAVRQAPAGLAATRELVR